MLNKQYWKTKSTITAFLMALLFLLGHLYANLGYDANGGKQTVGFFFFSPYMNWLPVDISSNIPVAWSMAVPLLSVLAGGMFAANQGRSGYVRLMRSRLNFKAYRLKTLMIGGVWGAVLPSTVLIIDFLGLLAIHPNVLPNQWLNNNVAISYLGFGGNFFYTHTWLYMLAWILLIALYGASYAVFSNFLYFMTGKTIVALLGLVGLQLLLLGISMVSRVSLAPMTYLQIVPTVGAPSLIYVLLWPFVLIGLSLLALRVPAVEV